MRRRKKTLLTGFLTSCVFLYLLAKNEESLAASSEEPQVVLQNQTEAEYCDSQTVILSSKLDWRYVWQSDAKCSKFKISHMIPGCRLPTALASYPGSGNTWLRYLIEGAAGIFTGSRYKDLQIQMYGLWGEIRSWEDGTTIVQKTHDSDINHIKGDFGGRAVLLLRNPYEAILSTHNFMYAGHHGRAPLKNFARPQWAPYVKIQLKRWLDMVTAWTSNDQRNQVLVVHYEHLKTDLPNVLRKILTFLNLPIDEDRLECLSEHRNGFFHRGSSGASSSQSPEMVAFNGELRVIIDKVIDHVNDQLLKPRRHEPMPTKLFNFYKQTDDEILSYIRHKNAKSQSNNHQTFPQEKSKDDEALFKQNRIHGTQMVLEQYIKWLDSDQASHAGDEANSMDDVKTQLIKSVFKTLKQNSKSNTITGLSEKAEGILSKAVEIWPILQQPFAPDPIDETLQTSEISPDDLFDNLV